MPLAKDREQLDLQRSGKMLKRLKRNVVPTVFSFRPLPQYRLEPTVRIFESKPLPKYGPPTYEKWLGNELQAMKELFKKKKSKIQAMSTQILSYENLVKQEKLFNKASKKGILHLENYNRFNNEVIQQCLNFLQPKHIQSKEQSSIDSDSQQRTSGSE